MKKLFCIIAVLALGLFAMAGCTDKTKKEIWQDFFSYESERVEESHFDDPNEELDAILDGTFVYAHRDFIVTNNSDLAFKNVYFTFLVVSLEADDFTFEVFIGDFAPHQTRIESLLDTRVELEMTERNIPTDQWWTIAISDIRYTKVE